MSSGANEFKTEINKNKETMQNIKNNNEQLFDENHININEFKLMGIKELKAKVDDIEAQVMKGGTETAGGIARSCERRGGTCA